MIAGFVCVNTPLVIALISVPRADETSDDDAVALDVNKVNRLYITIHDSLTDDAARKQGSYQR